MVEPSSDIRAAGHATSGLRAYLYLIRRYAWFALLVTAIAVGATFALTQRQERIYSASSSVLLRTSQTESLFPFADTGPRQLLRDAGTEQLYAQGPDFLAQARTDAPDGVSVRVSGDTNNLTFRATGTEPAAVAEAANAFAQSYVQARHQTLVAQTAEGLDFIETSIAELQTQRNEITAELDVLEALLENIDDPDQFARALAQKVSIEASLQPDLTPIDSQIRGFTEDLADLQLVTRFLDDPAVSARIARTAGVPSSPSSPNVPRNLIVGALLGMALGIGLPVLREALRDRVEHQEDVESVTDLVVLGSIPKYKKNASVVIESIDRPHSLASESYQAALTALEFASIGDTLSSVLFTSAAPAEGKTTSAVNLAALASQYLNVLLIDADMRRPNVHETLRVTNNVGLADVLRGRTDFLDARFTFSHGDARFDVLTSGPVPKDPALLLRGPAWSNLLDDLFLYDLVIVDSPPVLAVTDALLLGQSTGGQVLITSAGTTNRSEVAEAAELLSTNGGRSLGVLVNNEPQSRSNYYDYYGTYPSVEAPAEAAPTSEPLRRRGGGPFIVPAQDQADDESDLRGPTRGEAAPDADAEEADTDNADNGRSGDTIAQRAGDEQLLDHADNDRTDAPKPEDRSREMADPVAETGETQAPVEPVTADHGADDPDTPDRNSDAPFAAAVDADAVDADADQDATSDGKPTTSKIKRSAAQRRRDAAERKRDSAEAVSRDSDDGDDSVADPNDTGSGWSEKPKSKSKSGSGRSSS